MDLFQVVYSSQPFGYDTGILNGVLSDARRCNIRDGVTGALICRRDVYFQLLEGPELVVKATLERIRRDDRHVGVMLHLSAPTSERLFGDWAMLHDPAQSLMWTREQVSDGALEQASHAEARGVFEDLSARVTS
jgi:hypothetical protein